MNEAIPTLKSGGKARGQSPKRVGRTVRSPKLGMTLADFLALSSPDEQATNLEKILDGAAQQLGRAWDGRQVTIQLLQGASTRIDRVLWRPRTAVYADGPVHEFRPELASRDRMEQVELEGLGWRVFRLNWRELLTDPVRTVARVFYG
jgi:very-short-patch-repair endonuclease